MALAGCIEFADEPTLVPDMEPLQIAGFRVVQHQEDRHRTPPGYTGTIDITVCVNNPNPFAANSDVVFKAYEVKDGQIAQESRHNQTNPFVKPERESTVSTHSNFTLASGEHARAPDRTYAIHVHLEVDMPGQEPYPRDRWTHVTFTPFISEELYAEGESCW